MDKILYQSIRKELDNIQLIDAHSHICSEKLWKTMPDDFTSLILYCFTDLVCSGMERDDLPVGLALDDRMRFDYGYDIKPDNRSVEEKWKIIKRYWPYVRNIGSGLSTRKALRIYFDCDDLTDETVPAIQEKINLLKMKSYKDIFSEHKIAKIFGVTMDGNENPSTDIVAQQLYVDVYTIITKRRDVYRLEQLAGVDIYSLDTYLKALDALIDRQINEHGIVALKWHFTSYMRPFKFDITDKFEAEKCLDRILTLPSRGACGSANAIAFEEMAPLHNYLQNYIVQKTIEYDIPLQIHTGTFGGSMGSNIENSKPTWLTDLFLRYPQARFNLLHSSWPYMREIGELTRLFPNVYLNTAWMQILSPIAFKNFMKEWLTYIPTNKILAFGSDEFSPLLHTACAETCRDLMSEVLSELIEEGRTSADDALFMAKCVLYQNALDHYKLEI